ncbi:DMT family transporter [Bordetella sp. N]|uniref:DMT family transporter n=1 Tax=Bordetella sp. N TaxID=1746199 RepID=UPI0009EB8C67|nr:DMT family transporter [Bordetella sp. N]
MSKSASSSTALAMRLLPWAALLLPPLFWAGNFIAGRAMRDAMPPMTLALGRWVIALVCLLPFAWRGMRRDAGRYLAHRWLLLGTGVTGVAAFSSLVYVGLHTTTASNGLLLNSLIPLLIVSAGAIFYRQRLSAGQAVGLVLSFAGVLTLVLQGQWTQWRQVTLVPGDAILLVAMVCFSFYTLWLRQLPPELDRIGLTAIQIVIAIVVLLPFWVAEQAGGASTHWTPASVGALVYVGLFPSVGAYLLYGKAVQHFGPARAGLSIHLIPVFGVVLSALLLHERLHAWHAAGIAAIAAGLVCSNVGGRPAAPVVPVSKAERNAAAQAGQSTSV